MILKSLTVKNWGPFSSPTTLEVDPGVTVLTGRNDVGKSSLLALIERFYTSHRIAEQEVNVGSFRDSNIPWDRNPDIWCEATFTVTNPNPYFPHANLQPGDELLIRVRFAPHVEDRGWKILQVRRQGDEFSPGLVIPQKLPQVLYLPPKEEIGSPIETSTSNPLEKKFLTIAFGQYSEAKLSAIKNPEHLRLQVQEAEAEINKQLHKLLPPSMSLNFR